MPYRLTPRNAGGGIDPSFVVISTESSLTNERVITAGTGISIADNGAGLTVVINNTGVLSVAKSGSAALIGAVTLSAGANVTLTQVGQDISIAATAGAATPAGADTQVQFNDAGAFGGDAGLVYNKTTNVLTIQDSASQVIIGELGGGSTFAGLTGNSGGMAVDSYTLISDGTNTFLNAATGGTLALRIANSNKLVIDASGVTIDALAKVVITSTNVNVVGDELAASSTFGGFTMGSGITAMSSTDYSIIGNGTVTYINAKTGGEIGFRINNSPKILIDTNGNLGIGLTTLTAQFQVNTGVNTRIASIIKGAASQSANLTEWHDSSANILASVTAAGNATFANILSGTYTPTRSAEANMDANVTMTEAQYMRVGNTVTVSGRFTADPTLTATTTSFEITLPVASNIGAVEDVAGVAFCGNIAAMGAEVIGVVANDTAKIQWKASDVTSQVWSFTFSYQVI